MSATGRSDVREDFDVYVTPDWAIARFVEDYPIAHGATVLDPCAANGELLTELHKLRPDLRLIAIEIRPEAEPALLALQAAGVIEGYCIGDFCALPLGEDEVDEIITNPPYNIAEAMIRTGLRVAKRSSYLLRLNFLGAKERREFSTETRPGLKISPNRPSFTGWGGDACEYAWYCYRDADLAGTWSMLSLSSDAEIKDWNARARKRYPHLNPKLVKARKKAAEARSASTLCSECSEPQFNTPSGVTCSNGHGGASEKSVETAG